MSSKKCKRTRTSYSLKSNATAATPTPEFSQIRPNTTALESRHCISTRDENLLELAKTQWQSGEWENLIALDRKTILHHPERDRLALYAAVGHMQMGNIRDARALIKQAQEWGCDRELLIKILIAGIYNALGRASSLLENKEKVTRHFQASVSASSESDVRQLPIRVNQQKLTPRPSLTIKTLASHNLGDAWAGNTINTVIFRHHGILTHNKIQYTGFYVDTQTLRLLQRDLVTNILNTYDITGRYNLHDAHNSISLGIDRQGHLHICYDHHATHLRYRRSLEPENITTWSEELPMTGIHEERVTYPTFILPHNDFPLTLLYRDGVHDKGSARLKIYDETQQTWIDYSRTILDGAEQKPWTSNAYWNHPATGNDGSLHLSFVWRTHTLGEEQRINNINIGYAHSHDNGLTWQTSRNRPYNLPITQVNAETIHPVSPGSNLINQTSMALDSRNRPHIVFYADDPDGIPQYQHIWFNGKTWHHQIVSNRILSFSLQGAGTLQIPISRPDIVIDQLNNVYIITRGDYTKNRMTVTLLPAPDYVFLSSNILVINDLDVGFAEPIIDRERWRQDNILTLLLQHNQQPNNDTNHQHIQSPVILIDIQFRLNP